MIRLFVFAMVAWGMGALFFLLVALSDLAFSRRLKSFPKSLLICSVWPLALFSATGRTTLFHVFKQTQV